MFNKYFQDELAYLRELGREFSQAYPTLAPMLADRGVDPDVERLLEGVAFLTGRIRQKLDDEIPEFLQSLGALLFPHLMRALPSASILEITPVANALREAHLVKAGTEFASVPIDGLPWTYGSSRCPGPASSCRSRCEASAAHRWPTCFRRSCVSTSAESRTSPSPFSLPSTGSSPT